MSSKPFQNSLALHPLRAVRVDKARGPARKHQGLRRPAPLWYALWLPQLTQQPAIDGEQQARLQQIATSLGALSATVSIERSDGFLFEVGSTLRYFGGIEKVRTRLHALLEPLLHSWALPRHFHEAASPTPAASLLLARAACNLLVYRKDNLRAALGRLPLHTLALPERKKRQFHNSGLYILRDIWRLPSHAVAQRFGHAFTKQLEQCLGHVASPVQAYQSAAVFFSNLDCTYAIENKQALLPGVETLLERLCLFLHTRELAATHLHLAFVHEQQGRTEVEIMLRQANRSHAHFQLLLETRINALALPAPVIAMQLQVTQFAPFAVHNRTLSGLPAPQDCHADLNDLLPLLEQLQARLGNPAVRSIHCQDEHCPEQAGLDRPFGERLPAVAEQAADAAKDEERPYWLLAKPLPLRQEQGRLFYYSSLRLLSGPERIETHWWAPQEIQRDYYVARNRQGMRLWIFHERPSPNQHEARGWFLHGVFA